MKLKQLLSVAALFGMGMLTLPAHADVVHNLHLGFSNGAAYDGTVTFKDDYSSLQNTSGFLTDTNLGTLAFNWTWYASFGDPSGDEDGNPNTLEDYLMQGTDIDHSDFNQIGISWFVPVVGAAPSLNLAAYRANTSLNNFYRITSYEFGVGANNVPEPGSLALMGLGLLAAAAGARRKRG